MKKLFLIAMLTLMSLTYACTSKTKETKPADSTSTQQVDSVSVDTVDSLVVAVDTTVVAVQ